MLYMLTTLAIFSFQNPLRNEPAQSLTLLEGIAVANIAAMPSDMPRAYAPYQTFNLASTPCLHSKQHIHDK